MKPRIGLVVPNLARGGGVTSVARFVRDTIMRDGRFELEQVSLSTSSRDPSNISFSAPRTWLRGAATVPGVWETVPYSHVGAVGGELEFQRYRPRKALARALADCDLIQVVCGSPAWANTVTGLGKPVALQVATRARIERRLRDQDSRGLKGWWRSRMTGITDRMDDRALRQVDAIQVENPWMLEYAGRVAGGRRIDLRYAPPGIDARRFIPIPAAERMRDPYILCVARFKDPRKNIRLLLDAYARLPDEERDRTGLVLAGSTPPPEAFWKRADMLGVTARIRYIEKPGSDELLELYRHASVFALPSDEEGLGMVVLEAMACGVPVVSTRSGGPDGIINDGNDGYLVPLDDAAAMAMRLQCLLQQPERNCAMGKAARMTVERRYDERMAGEVFIDMWQHMLGNKGVRR